MYKQKQHLHFVGIGGVGMAGIAEILINLGYKVSGSDIKENYLISHLIKLGADINIGHSSDNINSSITAVVRSSAISMDNAEIVSAKENRIPIISRAQMLAELMRMKCGIAIAGSHGKTTTTSMTAKILNDVGLDPTVVVGGRVLNQATGAKLGKSQYFVAEADESDGSFQLLRPSIAVVTNIDYEHMGHYGDFDTLKKAFLDFINTIPFYGLVIACIDNEIIRELLSQTEKRVLTYGFSKDADICASELQNKDLGTQYQVSINNEEPFDVYLPVPGKHMVLNSLAAIGVAIELGDFKTEITNSLKTFPGVSRRTEVVSNQNGIVVVDDYGHHPTEVKATLSAIKSHILPKHKAETKADSKMVVLFEPHRYSRTKECFSEFRKAFVDADKVFISDIYSAGEKPIKGVDSRTLTDSIEHSSASYLPKFTDSIDSILSEINTGDVVVTLGAGSISKFARILVQKING